MTRNVEKTSSFYSEIIGLKLVHQTDTFAELRDYSPSRLQQFSLLVRQAPSLAHSTFGYSPILNFDMGINTNLDEIIQKAKNEYACELDGNILEDEYLKIACIRTPDG